MAADSQAIPENLRAAILLRALRYERAFAGGSGQATLVVAGASGDARQMETALRKLAKAGAAGRPMAVERVADGAADKALTAIKGHQPDAVYLAKGAPNPGLDQLSPGTIAMCANAAPLPPGCVLSVELSGQSPRLVVHLGQASRARLRFDARLLRLARVIR